MHTSTIFGLGSFKWYLLNQLVVAQSLDIGLLLFDPVFLGPYIAAYSSGVATYFVTTQLLYLAAFAGFTLFMQSFSSIYLSLFNRFVFLFRPHLKSRLHNKYTLICIVLFHAFFDGMFINAYFQTAVDHDAMVQMVHDDAGNALDRWINEPSFGYVPEWRDMEFTDEGIKPLGCLRAKTSAARFLWISTCFVLKVRDIVVLLDYGFVLHIFL
uniref:G protein-coupled receptor n=1 Tax=Panagrellus redivivus TaxID=6233 RepID=A0A7E4VG34_PANRE